MNGRRKAFNGGKWQITRERYHLADRHPPASTKDASAFEGIIPAVMKSLGLDDQHWMEALSDKWGEIVGADVAKHTRIGGLQKSSLTVFVDSPVWLNELTRYGRDKMLSNLHAQLGSDKIRSISLRLDPGK